MLHKAGQFAEETSQGPVAEEVIHHRVRHTHLWIKENRLYYQVSISKTNFKPNLVFDNFHAKPNEQNEVIGQKCYIFNTITETSNTLKLFTLILCKL